MSFLCVVLGLATAGLIVLVVSNRLSWEGERAQLRTQIGDLQSRVELANRLYGRQSDRYLDLCTRMLDGTPEQRRSLREAMDAQDARKDVDGEIIDPPPFSG